MAIPDYQSVMLPLLRLSADRADHSLREAFEKLADELQLTDAVRALEKAGFVVVRQGKHIVMSSGGRILTIPRHNPVNAFTLGGIVRDAGLSVAQLRELL